jgi:hypothetical protein
MKLRSQGPSCVFCVYGPKRAERVRKATCHHPLFWQMKGDPTADTYSAESLISTATARSEGGLCGPEAELFEPRRALSRVWLALRPYL